MKSYNVNKIDSALQTSVVSFNESAVGIVLVELEPSKNYIIQKPKSNINIIIKTRESNLFFDSDTGYDFILKISNPDGIINIDCKNTTNVSQLRFNDVSCQMLNIKSFSQQNNKKASFYIGNKDIESLNIVDCYFSSAENSLSFLKAQQISISDSILSYFSKFEISAEKIKLASAQIFTTDEIKNIIATNIELANSSIYAKKDITLAAQSLCLESSSVTSDNADLTFNAENLTVFNSRIRTIFGSISLETEKLILNSSSLESESGKLSIELDKKQNLTLKQTENK